MIRMETALKEFSASNALTARNKRKNALLPFGKYSLHLDIQYSVN